MYQLEVRRAQTVVYEYLIVCCVKTEVGNTIDKTLCGILERECMRKVTKNTLSLSLNIQEFRIQSQT